MQIKVDSWPLGPKVRRARKTVRTCPTEHQEMVAFNHWKLSHIPVYPELSELFVIPIGVAARDWKVNKKGVSYSPSAKRLKDAGVVSGPSDYFLPVARGGYPGYFRELKAMDGRPSEEQLDFIERMLRQGYKADWCKGWEALRDGFLEYLKIPPTTLPMVGPWWWGPAAGAARDDEELAP